MSCGLPIYQGDEQPFSQHDLFSLAKLNCPEAHGAAIRHIEAIMYVAAGLGRLLKDAA